MPDLWKELDAELKRNLLVATGDTLDRLAERFGVPPRSAAQKFEPHLVDPLSGTLLETDDSLRERIIHKLTAQPGV
jgi:hypothetical protein